jgi:hypothetical protein
MAIYIAKIVLTTSCTLFFLNRGVREMLSLFFFHFPIQQIAIDLRNV